MLLRKFGAPLLEQVAGLLHDISHTVFSHCVDYALSEGSQTEHNFQDKYYEKFLKNSEIPAILSKYHIDLDLILNENNFPLKEKKLPDLCADRLDYSFRDGLSLEFVDQAFVNSLLAKLTVINNYWAFEEISAARKYAEYFLSMNRQFFSGFLSALMFQTTGAYLRYAFEKKFIEYNDLFTTDEQVLKKINQYLRKDKQLFILWKRMNNLIKVKNSPKDFDEIVLCKSRMVDPLFREKGKIERLSDVEPKWKKIVEDELNPKRYFLKFEE